MKAPHAVTTLVMSRMPPVWPNPLQGGDPAAIDRARGRPRRADGPRARRVGAPARRVRLRSCAAATDMVGRAAVPPDAFDVSATPRGGQGIDQRLVVGDGRRREAGRVGADTPRAEAGTSCRRVRRAPARPGRGRRRTPAGRAGRRRRRCDLADLGLSALDLAADGASQGQAAPFPLLLHLAQAARDRGTGTPARPGRRRGPGRPRRARRALAPGARGQEAAEAGHVPPARRGPGDRRHLTR